MEAIVAAAFGALGVVAGSILTARLGQAVDIQATRQMRLEQFGRLAYEHVRDLRRQVTARLKGEPSGHLTVADTEQLGLLRSSLAILAPGACETAATALLEQIRTMDETFDATATHIDVDAWNAANRRYDELLSGFEREAAKASGLGDFVRRLYGY